LLLYTHRSLHNHSPHSRIYHTYISFYLHMSNSYDTNFDAPAAHCNNIIYLYSDVSAENCGNPKCYDCKDPNKPKTIAVKWSQIWAMNEGDNHWFWNESIKFNLILIVKFIFVFSSKCRCTKLLGCRDSGGFSFHQQRPRTMG
jgi:hypothetical protein